MKKIIETIISFLLKLFGKKNEPVNETTTTEITEKPKETMEKNETLENEVYEVVLEEGEKPEIGKLETPEEDFSGKDFYILLDNGHASTTPGKRSPEFEDGSRFFEYEFNRAVVAKIAKKLDAVKIKYHILVPEVDYDVPLTTRAARANEYCKKYGTAKCLFISVHSNAAGRGENWTCKEASAGGWSIYTTKGVTKSDTYAKVFYRVAQETLPKYGFRCRDGKHSGDASNEGPDHEANFTVIYKTSCPAVLTENMFFTNRKECEWLLTDEGREVIADIHVEAIKRIINSL